MEPFTFLTNNYKSFSRSKAQTARDCVLSTILAKTAVCVPETISTPDSETRRIHFIMCTEITLFTLDAVKASLLKMTLCFFSTDTWQEGESDIQVIKTLRFTADAKGGLHPYKQRRQKSLSSDGPEHGSCGPGLQDSQDYSCSAALTK